MRLEDLLNKPENKFVSAGVFRLDHDGGIKYTAPIDVTIDDGGVSEYVSGIEALTQAEQIDIDRLNQSTQKNNIPDYLINDPEIVGYPDLEMQKEIYDWVLQGLPYTNYSIKDLGAGRGDFYGSIPYSKDVQYIGFETKEGLVLAGRKKYENIELVHGDYFNSDIETDYTICIGTLNEDHGNDKWEHFNKTLKHCIYTTKIAIIFILSSNMDQNPGFLDYPLNELFNNLPTNLRFAVDYTRMEDIYKLTVHIGGYDS